MSRACSLLGFYGGVGPCVRRNKRTRNSPPGLAPICGSQNSRCRGLTLNPKSWKDKSGSPFTQKDMTGGKPSTLNSKSHETLNPEYCRHGDSHYIWVAHPENRQTPKAEGTYNKLFKRCRLANPQRAGPSRSRLCLRSESCSDPPPA